MISCAVLAGGESRRMGTDKSLVEFEGGTLVARAVRTLRAISDDVFVVGKRDADVVDRSPEQSPLAGVIAALAAARHPLVFVCACDMPFVSVDLAMRLAAGVLDADVGVPRCNGRFEPLHAVWSTNALSDLEAIWDAGERSVHGAISKLGARIVDVADARPFVNVNTPGELDAIRHPT